MPYKTQFGSDLLLETNFLSIYIIASEIHDEYKMDA